jgi:UDP-N-acetylglucosamine:LPS N-acetylglucosamine transferase
MPNKDKNKAIKVGIICSPGGHLAQALYLIEAFKNTEIFLVTYNFPSLAGFKHPDIKNVYCLTYFGDSFINIFFTLLLSPILFLRIFLKERPNVLFSTGSEISIFGFYLGKMLFMTKLIYLETVVRSVAPTLAARLNYPICDLFLVQWEQMLKRFGKKAKYAGRLI